MNIIDTLRIPKIANFVVFDWGATIAMAILIEKIFNVNVYLTFIILIIISIFLHISYKVDTMTNYYLGLSNKPIR